MTPDEVAEARWDSGGDDGEDAVMERQALDRGPASPVVGGDERRAVLERNAVALALLVSLKDGPRDESYEQHKPSAWEIARQAVADLRPLAAPSPTDGGPVTVYYDKFDQPMPPEPADGRGNTTYQCKVQRAGSGTCTWPSCGCGDA